MLASTSPVPAVSGLGLPRSRSAPCAFAAFEEVQPRLAILSVPVDTVLVTLPTDRATGSIWGGIASQPGELMTHGPGRRVTTWTNGPCRWSAIWISARELQRHGRVLVGDGLTVPAGTRPWRPRAAALRTLRALHATAIHAGVTHPDALAHAEAARGLHQRMIHALVESLADGPVGDDAPARCRHRDIALRFEALLSAQPECLHGRGSISPALGVTRRSLGMACHEQLGMGPAGFIRVHRLYLARHALRSRVCDEASVLDVARRYGFSDLARFAHAYRHLFGELPSAALRRTTLKVARDPR